MQDSGHDIIVIGASAGGVEALTGLVSKLPADLPAAIFVVVHIGRHHTSSLPEILARAGSLPAEHALDQTPIERGKIYVALPDHHLLLEKDRVRVTHGPKENRNRPAIDPLFRSAAWSFGPRVAGIVLSGTLDDGAAGLWAIKTCGGTSIVQDPGEAKFSGMPTSALLYSKVDHCKPIDQIAPLLVQLAHETAHDHGRPTEAVQAETEMNKRESEIDQMNRVGDLSAFTCPGCGGALWEVNDGGILRYRCHVGHAFSSDSLIDEQTEFIEKAVYTALRALKEKADIVRRVAGQFAGRHPDLESRYVGRVRELEEASDVLRGLLHSGKA